MARFTIGTRGSPLALWQANEVKNRLCAALHLAEDDIELAVIRTSGDAIQDRALAQAGGKGLFTKEIDEAQLSGVAHFAVHSAKDMPTLMPDGLIIAGYLEREDVRDAFISARAPTLLDLPEGALIGTASLRRQALVKRLRPDIKTVLLRGNVETRLRKVEGGELDATLLALAGLKRLGFVNRVTSVLDKDVFPPAVGQGAIAITTREDDAVSRAAVEQIAHVDTGIALLAERAFLRELDGSCRTPIAGLATVTGERLILRGLVLRSDGSESYEEVRDGLCGEAERIGTETGRTILQRAPADILTQTPVH